MFYATIDEDNICYGVSSDIDPAARNIEIENFSADYIGATYLESGEWDFSTTFQYNSTIPSLEERILILEQEVAELKSYINSIGKTELVGTGSAEMPFEWREGIDLIPNAYYLYNDTRYVYLGQAKVATAADIPNDDDWDNWAEF